MIKLLSIIFRLLRSEQKEANRSHDPNWENLDGAEFYVVLPAAYARSEPEKSPE